MMGSWNLPVRIGEVCEHGNMAHRDISNAVSSVRKGFLSSRCARWNDPVTWCGCGVVYTRPETRCDGPKAARAAPMSSAFSPRGLPSVAGVSQATIPLPSCAGLTC
jgi:hypothetical protein